MDFKEFNLHPGLLRGITEAGYINCMPVQEQVLANAFSGQDLCVQSQTGTGKTAAFLVVIFQRLLSEELLTGKSALIMVPTRVVTPTYQSPNFPCVMIFYNTTYSGTKI